MAGMGGKQTGSFRLETAKSGRGVLRDCYHSKRPESANPPQGDYPNGCRKKSAILISSLQRQPIDRETCSASSAKALDRE